MSVNVAAFERELAGELDELLQKDVPGAIVELALELRQNAEDGTPRKRGVGAGAWMSATEQTKPRKDPRSEPGGHEAAKAALQNWRIGMPLWVFNNAFFLYFLERGTMHIPGRHFLQRALLAMQDRTVRL